VTTPQSERQKLLRRGFALGRQKALRPPEERNERLALIRRHLSLVSDNDRLALLAEFAIGNGTDMMLKAASLLLGGVVVLGSHMSPIYRIHFASTIHKEAERLAFHEQTEVLH
jgi:hypothetical protein